MVVHSHDTTEWLAQLGVEAHHVWSWTSWARLLGWAIVTPGFKGQTRARLKCVQGLSLTHMMTHGIEKNVTSLIYNGVLYKIVK
jgi:hypothetical protein